MSRFLLASLLAIFAGSPFNASASLAPFAPQGTDTHIGEWLFQPGEAVAAGPVTSDWEVVKVPFLWTSGGGRMIKPEGRALAEWARTPNTWRGYDNGWFERTVSIPSDWKGQRVWLAFDQIECDALLWIDGGEPVLLAGPEARVDITTRVKPGKDAVLRLWVTRWWRDISRTMDDAPLRKEALEAAGMAAKGGLDSVRREIPAGLPGYVTLQARPFEAEITGAFARPSFREKTLAVDVDISATAAAKSVRLRVQVLDPQGQGGQLPPAVTVPLDVTGDGVRTVSIPWDVPRLWQLGEGYLYQLKTELVDSSGQVVHAPAPETFGFREVWVEGREIMMNGRPIRLRLAPVISPDWPALLFWEGIGFNAAQWHPHTGSWFVRNGQRSLIVSDEDNPGMRRLSPEPINNADRRGFALLMPSPNVGMVRSALSSEAGRAAYERECRLWFKRLRNHPSIIMWNPSMNTGSSSRENAERLGMLPEGEDRVPGWATRCNEIIKSVDPTRIVAHHCGMGGEIDYPNQYLNFLPLQERIEFPSHWAEKGDIPWGAIEHGTPYLANMLKPLNIPQFTEWSAVYFGDRAYTAESDDYVTLVGDYLSRKAKRPRADEWGRFAELSMQYEFDTLFTTETNRYWRAWGVGGGWKPWNFNIGYGVPPSIQGKPKKGDGYSYSELTEAEALATIDAAPEWANPIYHSYRATMRPLLAFLGGPAEHFTAKDHAFRAGERFEKTAVVVWDGNKARRLKAEWRLESGGKTLWKDSADLALKPGDIVKHPIPLKAPDVTTRTEARLSIIFTGDGERIEDGMDLTFWPAEPAVAVKSRWALFDPSGNSAGWLRSLGVNAVPVKTRMDLSRVRAEVLVVAREGLVEDIPFDAADIARGLRVLVLEQKPAALESVGLRIQDIVTRYAFPRDRAHEALRGLDASDLANWRGAPDLLPKTKVGMKPWPLARPPHWGNQGAVASVVIETPSHGAFTPLMDAEFDLAYSPLLEWRHGRGGVLFCQLDVTGRTDLDPAARRVALNIIRSLDLPYESDNSKSVKYAGDEAGWDYIRSIEFAAERFEAGELNVQSDLLVVGPGSWAAQRARAEAFASSGGTVLVLPQDPASLAPLKTTEVKSARVVPDSDPLLRGVGPQMLNWRTFVTQQRFNRDGQTAGARVLLDGLVLDQRSGKGRLVFSQLDWTVFAVDSANLEKPRWHSVQFYRQMLANLGARTANDVAAGLFNPRRVAPLVNVGVWRVFNSVAQVEPVVKDGMFPGLGRRFPMESESAAADARANDDRGVSANIGEGEVAETGLTVASTSAGWRTYGPRGSSGRVHLDWISPAQTGKIGYARTYVYSSRDREALFAIGGDNWLVFRVNKNAYVDHSRQPRQARTPFSGEFRFKAKLTAGWNLLEAKVASGSGGFGFWAMVSDPGDASFETTPKAAPASLPARDALLDEPEIETRDTFYIRPLRPEDDPYRFNPW
jgi:beta-galactosidase